MPSHHALLVHDQAPLQYSFAALIGREPDRVYRLEKCTISDVRTITAAAWLRPQHDQSEQLIAIAADFIVEEAQQALLKIVEEPPHGTRFLFVLPRGYNVLPTLHSRFQVLQGSAEVVDTAVFETFKQASYADRLTQIETALKQKDTLWQTAIKTGLANYLKNHRTKTSPETLQDLVFVVTNLLTRGASNKFLLEQLALVLESPSKS